MKKYVVTKGWYEPVYIDVEVEVPDDADTEAIIKAADEKLESMPFAYEDAEPCSDGVTQEWVESIKLGDTYIEVPEDKSQASVVEEIARRERLYG